MPPSHPDGVGYCRAVGPQSSPFCQPPDGTYDTLHRYGRAQPATRHLRLMRNLGAQATVASVCTAPIAEGQPGFAYGPAIDAIVRDLRRRLTRAGEAQ